MGQVQKMTLKGWVKRHKKPLIKWGIIYIGLLVTLVSQVKLIHLTSESIPYRYCLQFHNLAPKKGDLCVFDYCSKSKNVKFTFVKYLVGMEGDLVKRIENRIYVNSKLVGLAKPQRNLTPMDDIVIPKGRVFVAGTHADSLDSRYKEFGFIKESALRGKAVGCIRR